MHKISRFLNVYVCMQFPPLCWFEKLNYSVLLRHDGMESVVVEESVLNPPEYVMHNITAYVKAGTDYSIVVLAGTTVWNTVTDTHNFSELHQSIHLSFTLFFLYRYSFKSYHSCCQ